MKVKITVYIDKDAMRGYELETSNKPTRENISYYFAGLCEIAMIDWSQRQMLEQREKECNQ